jgi:hypothetical protein
MDFSAPGDSGAADGTRDMLALIRARHEGDQEGIDAILGTAGEAELRAIAATFTASFGDLLIRLTVAASLIEDDHMRMFALTTGTDVMNSDPDIHAEVARNIAAYQATFVTGTTA